jgi:subtilisin family serine protease
VAGLINRFSKNTPHCLVSIKFYSENGSNVETMLQSIQYAINIKADVINISAGGTWPNLTEKLLIKRALDMGIKVVAAAGNEASNLDIQCSFFPACYDRRVVSVGNLEERSQPLWEGVAEAYLTYPAKLSNYGTYVSRWEIGSNVTSNLPGGRLGTMSGTSQAAAVATGKIVGEMRRVYAK